MFQSVKKHTFLTSSKLGNRVFTAFPMFSLVRIPAGKVFGKKGKRGKRFSQTLSPQGFGPVENIGNAVKTRFFSLLEVGNMCFFTLRKTVPLRSGPHEPGALLNFY